MAAGGKINHPKSVYGKKNSIRKGKVKKINRKLKKKKGGERKVDQLVTTNILKKTRTNPSANITLSGKKKRLLLKQLKREAAQKHEMDVVVVAKSKTETTSKRVEKMDMS